MSANTRAVVLVPGAWNPPGCYSKLVKELEQAGFSATAIQLSSFDAPNPSLVSCTSDTNTVRDALLPLIEEQGKEVVVVSHSYGGIPAGGAARGLSKTARARAGREGGVVAMYYITAFIVPEGTTLLNMMGGTHAPYVQENQVCIQGLRLHSQRKGDSG